MNKLLYPRLAAENLRKNSKAFVPYLLTCIGCIMMFYIMCSLVTNQGMSQISGGNSLILVLKFGSIIIGIFSVIFLLYTNSFLIKQRKKELGLFNILGMEKKHIGKILFYETAFTALITLVLGLLCGFLFARLMSLLLLRLMLVDINWDFGIAWNAVWASIKLFGFLFLLTLINNLRQIQLTNPIDLLKGGQVGEREPKTKLFMAILGVISLAIGYYLALTASSPNEAVQNFFTAVLLVILGTYLLFTSGSILLLKLLRKNKDFYYRTNHFISISGMMYRMKQNAAGLASICILSCAVLVMLSSTVTLYAGIQDVVRTRYPRDYMIYSYQVSEESIAATVDAVNQTLSEAGIEAKSPVSYHYLQFKVNQDGNRLTADTAVSMDYQTKYLCVIPLEDYNRLAGKQETLESQEAIIFSSRGSYGSDTLSLFGSQFTVRDMGQENFLQGNGRSGNLQTYYLIVADMQVYHALYEQQSAALGERQNFPTYYHSFDVDASQEASLLLSSNLSTRLSQLPFGYSLECKADSLESAYSLYGGLFFLGIFLGILFIMATVLMIYYKQISEGYDDKARFEIMQKVGLSQKESKSSIHSQILLMFFLPLVAAAIHITFAFPLITQLLTALNLTNVKLFALCTLGTILTFTVFYGIVYGMTSKVYYQIVKR